MSNVYNYIRRVPKDKLNILTFPTHKRYETELTKTGHNFYAAYMKGMPEAEDYGIENYHLMPMDQFYPYDGYDLILSQSRFGQFTLATKMANKLQVPIITLEHTVPTPDLKLSHIEKMGSMVGDVNIFICEYSQRVWSELGINKNNNVIKHSVDTDLFKNNGEEKGGYVLTVANDFIARDYCLNFSLWREVYETYDHPMVVLGKNSDKISSNFRAVDGQDLVDAYSGCLAYLNTTSHSSIPMSLLEAMSCECPVITSSTCGITEFVEDGVNGLIADTAEEIDKAIKTISGDKDLANRLGKNARQTILEKCSQERFVNEWNEIFMKTYEASL